MTWWCSARGLPWDGQWQAYPGVWGFAILVAALFWIMRPRGTDGLWPRRLSLIAGLVLLWVTLDWPVGPLGAGYLVSVHSAQFLMLAMVIPPLLLMSVDRAQVAAVLQERPRLDRFVEAATRPLFAIVAFAVTMVFTHLPRVVDALMVSQLGAFALDLAWFAAGLLFWWPVIVRIPDRAHFPPLMQMLYLFFGTQPHLYIGMWLLGADFPAYATYELAPRVSALSAITDQQVAGAVMLGFGATYILGAITVLFFRWAGTHTAPGPEAVSMTNDL
jgi:cytochrome c oxidase assembly factor CtaG